MPRSNTNALARLRLRCASAISASVPPSPLLSARTRMRTYLIVTTMISDQRISDRTPRTLSSAADRAGGVHRFAEGVEGACADVAVDDADGADGQRQKPCLRRRVVSPVRMDRRAILGPAARSPSADSGDAATQREGRFLTRVVSGCHPGEPHACTRPYTRPRVGRHLVEQSRPIFRRRAIPAGDAP